jgi:hypothetical protein
MILHVAYTNSSSPPRDPHEAAERSTVIPGSADAAAREVQKVSPEGFPGDPKSGPAWIRMERAIAVGIVIVAVAASGFWVGWEAAVAAFVVGMLALMFNPVMAAVGQRAKDRVEVIERMGEAPGPPEPRG